MRDVHHPSQDELRLADVLHALSDPVRLEIVRTLALAGERSCGALGTRVAKSTLSHHLKVLREAGVTSTRVRGTQRLISLREADLEARFSGLLSSVLQASRASTVSVDGPRASSAV